MLHNERPRHYLAQFYGANDNPHERHCKVNLVARALYPRAGVKSFASLQVRIVGLRENGAIIQSSAIEFLPDHFYICLGEGEIFLTCAKQNVTQAEMVVSFSQPVDAPFIQALSRIDFPLSTLKRLDGYCHPAVQARIVRSRRGA